MLYSLSPGLKRWSSHRKRTALLRTRRLSRIQKFLGLSQLKSTGEHTLEKPEASPVNLPIISDYFARHFDMLFARDSKGQSEMSNLSRT